MEVYYDAEVYYVCRPKSKRRFNCITFIEGFYIIGSLLALCFLTRHYYYGYFNSIPTTTAALSNQNGLGETFALKRTQRGIDYALEATGGQIEQTINTEDLIPGLSLFGLKICDGPHHGPRSIIQANTAPGQCWAFKGHKGRVIIKLMKPVKINAVTLEHIPAKVSPQGDLSSAPKDFLIKVSNHSDGKRGKCLGRFKYDINGKAVQTFPVNNTEDFYRFVDFEVLTNHGKEEFTCVYRLQVHGDPVPMSTNNIIDKKYENKKKRSSWYPF